MALSDTFVCLDDVNFKKKGWIHRNRLLFNGEISYFSIPLKNPSQNTLIKDMQVSTENYSHWRDKFLKSFTMYYKKAPYYAIVRDLVEDIFYFESDPLSLDPIFPKQGLQKNENSCLQNKSISCNKAHVTINKNLNFLQNKLLVDLARQSLIKTCKLLKLETHIIPTSANFKKENMVGEERIVSICKELNATDYYNLSGGIELYKPERFKEENINLHFVSMDLEKFQSTTKNKAVQNNAFLSILDTLMHLGVDLTRACILEENIL